MIQWTEEDLQAFFCCVRANDSVGVPDHREGLVAESMEQLFWAYNSKAKAHTKQVVSRTARTAFDHLPDSMKSQLPQPSAVRGLHEYVPTLNYAMLLRGCCKELNIEGSDLERIALLEVYLYEKVMVLAVAAMTAAQRHMFLTCPVNLDDASVAFPKTGIKGASTTLAALGAAQASGFGVYLGATTALGFVSHAIGVTLPFAVYTGMSSTIAFLIGPVGFLAAGAWLGWSLTGPEWTRVLRGLLHIVAMRAKYEYNSKRLEIRSTAPRGMLGQG
jgi:hypothetical protein